jgi:putative transposase
MRGIRRRPRVVGVLPDGQSGLDLATARLRHIAGTKWSMKRYMNMQLLRQKETIA